MRRGHFSVPNYSDGYQDQVNSNSHLFWAFSFIVWTHFLASPPPPSLSLSSTQTTENKFNYTHSPLNSTPESPPGIRYPKKVTNIYRGRRMEGRPFPIINRPLYQRPKYNDPSGLEQSYFTVLFHGLNYYPILAPGFIREPKTNSARFDKWIFLTREWGKIEWFPVLNVEIWTSVFK